MAATAFVLVYHGLILLGVTLQWLPRTIFGRLSSPFVSVFPLGLGALLTALLMMRVRPQRRQKLTPFFLILGSVPLGHLGFAIATRDYQTARLAGYLEQTLGQDAILVADWAPNLCLENRMRAIPVFDGLANDKDPIRTLHADYVLVGQTAYPKKLWRKWCPELQKPANFISMLSLNNYKIALYRVPREAKQ